MPPAGFRFHHVAVQTADLSRARRFYETVLGCVVIKAERTAKGREILGSMKAGLLFHWKSLRRQVRIRGIVEVVTEAEADEYYASRPRLSRIGAWASKQSRPLESRFALEKAVAAVTAKYPIGDIPRPEQWSGFRIKPVEIEFWKDGEFRLHDRIKFEAVDGGWKKTRLYP